MLSLKGSPKKDLSKQLIYDFWAGKNYPDLLHSQGGMKFATQISPLLNLYIFQTG